LPLDSPSEKRKFRYNAWLLQKTKPLTF